MNIALTIMVFAYVGCFGAFAGVFLGFRDGVGYVAGVALCAVAYDLAGWFVGGPEPGENGAAVIVGHVDSKSGPAVFFRLRALRPGDRINVVLKNKSTVRFVVRSKRAVLKKRFPTALVFGKTKTPTLRLITCDGRFDRSTGHYVDNLVVVASLV